MGNVKNLIIIPTYNEEVSIGILLKKLVNLRKNISVHEFDILIVDDNSPDKTINIVKSFDTTWIYLEVRSSKKGLADAYKFGFNWASNNAYDYVIEMDADGSHQVEDLCKIFEVDQKYDLVIGSRWISGGAIENWSFLRKIISKYGNLYEKFALGINIKDSTSGFRRLKISTLPSLNLDNILSRGYGFQIEVAARFFYKNYDVIEVPITFIDREFGKSKMTATIALEAFYNITKIGVSRILARLLQK